MRNRIVALLVLLSALALGVLVGTAQDDTIWGLITVDLADVRVGPDWAYDIVGQLPLNTSVVVRGRAGDFYRTWDGRQWIQLELGSRLAWVYARLVRTSVAFNAIPPTGRMLPRTRDGRVPDGFDLSSSVCEQWVGSYGQSGNFMAGDPQMVVTFPALQGANLYTVIVIDPTGFRTPFDSDTNTATIRLDRLPYLAGTYTWRVAPYWTDSLIRAERQQICLLQTGGTFDKPDTTPPTPTPRPR